MARIVAGQTKVCPTLPPAVLIQCDEEYAVHPAVDYTPAKAIRLPPAGQKDCRRSLRSKAHAQYHPIFARQVELQGGEG
jgi:hypothetical protein